MGVSSTTHGTTMALQGSLRQLRLGDVLQTVLQAGQAGAFHLRSEGRRAVVHASEQGLRLLEPDVLDEAAELEALQQRRLVPVEVLQRARATAGPRDSVIAALLASGDLDKKVHRQLLREAVEDCLLDVLAWTDGDFRFEDGTNPDLELSPAAQVFVEASSLLLHAAQRQDERKQIADRIGAAAVLAAAVDAPDPAALERAEDVERRVLARLDGRSLMKEVALAEGLTLFAAQRAVAGLVDKRLARLPSSEELAEAATARTKARDVGAALALLRQWQCQHPRHMEAFETAVEIAAGSGRPEDEADALRALGHAYLAVDKIPQSRDTFDKLLRRRPGDLDAMEGLRRATRALRDQDGFSTTSRALAEAALGSGDGTRAVLLLTELISAHPEDLPARLLLTKALTRTGDRDKAVVELERLAMALPTPCRRKWDREAAAWARDTLVQLAPDRSDLLRRYRTMLEGKGTKRTKVAILVALLCALSAAGFVLWPRPAASLLARAQTALDRGDTAEALTAIAELTEQYADTPEAAEAALLRIRVGALQTPRATFDPKEVRDLLVEAEETRKALSRWPQPAAVALADLLATHLRTPAGSAAATRKSIVEALRDPFAVAISALRREALERRDALDGAVALAQRPPRDVEAFRTGLERALAAMDPKWVQDARQAAGVARRLAVGLPELAVSPETLADLRSMESDIEGAARSINSRVGDLATARREFHRALVVDAYEKARSEAVKDLVRGDLDGAEAYYGRLDALLSQLETDPALRPLRDAFQKRGILEFARARMDTMRTLRRGLSAAQAAEATGNLAGAAAAYARVAQQYPSIRFDAVFTIPMRILPVPAGAEVAVNGRIVPAGADGTVVVRYGWGSATTLSVTAEGFEPRSIVLATNEARPVAELYVGLVPRLRWAEELPALVEAPLLSLGDGVLACTRSGRVHCYDGATGTLRWSADLKSLEGVRGRPAVTNSHLWVPLLEGRLARLDATTGQVLASLDLRSRPVGDAAAAGDHVAVAISESVAIFGPDGAPTYVALPAATTVGVLAAHDAFWVGDAAGGVTRIDPATGKARTVALADKSPLVGLARGEGSIYALAGDGTLYCVNPRAETSVVWRRPGLGDVVGPPAEAGSEVLVAERGGRVRILEASTGVVKADLDLRVAPLGGLVASGGRVLAALGDGRLWAYEPGRGVIVDGDLGARLRLAPVVLTDGTVLAPSREGRLGAFAPIH